MDVTVAVTTVSSSSGKTHVQRGRNSWVCQEFAGGEGLFIFGSLSISGEKGSLSQDDVRKILDAIEALPVLPTNEEFINFVEFPFVLGHFKPREFGACGSYLFVVRYGSKYKPGVIHRKSKR